MMACQTARGLYGLTAECCVSCHEDEDLGFDASSTIFDDVNGDIETCCKVNTAYNETVRSSKA
jgi:hypothetical protein